MQDKSSILLLIAKISFKNYTELKFCVTWFRNPRELFLRKLKYPVAALYIIHCWKASHINLPSCYFSFDVYT